MEEKLTAIIVKQKNWKKKKKKNWKIYAEARLKCPAVKWRDIVKHSPIKFFPGTIYWGNSVENEKYLSLHIFFRFIFLKQKYNKNLNEIVETEMSGEEN